MPDSVSWARLYHSFLDNRKTANLTAAQVGSWLRIFLLASRNTPRGKLPDNKILNRYLGAGLGKNPNRLNKLLAFFIQANLIDKASDGSLWLHNFTSRQWLSSQVEIPISTNCSTVVSTDCGNSLLISCDENKRVIAKGNTELVITETYKDIYRGLERLFVGIKDLLSTLRIEAGRLNSAPGDDGSSALVSRTDVSPKEPELFSLSSQRIDKRNSDHLSITALWNSLPGLVHHKSFTDSDKRAVFDALQIFSASEIKTAIERYSIWAVGAIAGQYRECYRWTFYEFITRHKGALIKRLISNEWENTCRPFTNKQYPKPVSVSDLLAAAEKRRTIP
jgi:hypothetical protein